MHFSHLPQQYKYSSVKHSYLNLFSMVLKLSGTSHLPYFAKLKHILASPIRISTTCTWIMSPFIGTVSDTNFPRGLTAHPTGARWGMFTAFRILVCIREKEKDLCSYFPTSSSNLTLCAAEIQSDLPSFTCLKNSSSRDMVQRWWRSQALAGWLISAVCNNSDKAFGLSILETQRIKQINCLLLQWRMTKISPKQGNEVVRIFGQDINEVVSVFIKSDNSERLSNFSKIHHSCCKRDIQKCKRNLCSALLSSFPGLLHCTSRLEELLFSPFQLGCGREVGPAEHRIWAQGHWWVYTVTDQCFPDGKLVRDQEGILAPGFTQQKKLAIS